MYGTRAVRSNAQPWQSKGQSRRMHRGDRRAGSVWFAGVSGQQSAAEGDVCGTERLSPSPACRVGESPLAAYAFAAQRYGLSKLRMTSRARFRYNPWLAHL